MEIDRARYQEWRNAVAMVKAYQDRAMKLRDGILSELTAAGEVEGTVEGYVRVRVRTRSTISRARLLRDRPDAVAEYVTLMPVLDVGALTKDRPDLARDYAVRELRAV